MSDSPLVSVVTPFHNTEAYLAQCIESVLTQTFRNIEYILVDNRSTDGSPSVAAHYAEHDPRIRVIRTDRLLPQVQNYNFALEQISAQSHYCKLVQADDWIFPSCLAEMVAVGEERSTIGLVSALALHGPKLKNTGLPYPARYVPGREVCRRQLLEGMFLFGSPTAVLYRSDAVRGRRPFFEEGRLHEDTETCYELLKSWDFGFVHQVLSFMRTDNVGIMEQWQAYNPNLLDRYIVVQRFGRDFLTAAEFREVSRRERSHYFAYLGQSFLEGREGDFWEHHRRGLASVGEALPTTRVLRWSLVAALRNPTSAGRTLLRRRNQLR